MEEALKLTQANLQAWRQMMQATAEDVGKGRSTPERRLATIQAAISQFGDSLPPLRSNAWDAALASQAVSYLDHQDLGRYSQVYASQRFFIEGMWHVLQAGALRNLADLTLAQARNEADAAQLLDTLNWRVQSLTVIASDLSQLRTVLAQAGH